MRREDIIEAADHIATFVAGLEVESFVESEVIRSAVVQKLSVIGEAAARVSSETRDRHQQIPWARLVAFRNILIHAYFGIDWEEVWRLARNRCPELRDQIAEVLAAVEQGPQPDH